MSVNAADVKKLRDMTNAGFMDCKKALAETNGDLDGAVKLLRERGIAKAVKVSSRVATEGLVNATLAPSGASGVLVEVNCNTDFVARNPDFVTLASELTQLAHTTCCTTPDQLVALPYRGKTVKDVLIEQTATIGENISVGRVALLSDTTGLGLIDAYIHPPGKIGVLLHIQASDASVLKNDKVKQAAHDICLHIAACAPRFVDSSAVDAATLEAEKAIYINQALNEGKPQAIAEKMVAGRIKKFYEQVCLLDQPFVKDGDVTVAKVLAAAAKDAGGELKVVAFARIAVGEGVEEPAES